MDRPAVVDDRKTDEKGHDVYGKLDAYLIDKFPRHRAGTFVFEPEFELPDVFVEEMKVSSV